MVKLLFSNNLQLLRETYEFNLQKQVKQMEKQSTKCISLESISKTPDVIEACEVENLTNFDYTAEGVMNIFIKQQNQFYQQHNINHVVFSSYQSKQLKHSNLSKIKRILEKIDGRIFDAKEFMMEFLVLNTTRVDHAFLLEVRLQHPKNLDITIDSNIRRTCNKIWYNESMKILIHVLTTLNSTTSSSYKIPSMSDVKFNEQDEIQQETHCVPSILLKTLRNSYCIMMNISKNEITITNAMNRKWCLILALNARSIEDLDSTSNESSGIECKFTCIFF